MGAPTYLNSITTERLNIRPVNNDDAIFIQRLYNTEGFLRFVSDKGIHSLAVSRERIIQGPFAKDKDGIGMQVVMLKNGYVPIGISGLIKRDYLDFPDLGFGFLPEFMGFGYAYEAASAFIRRAKKIQLPTLFAITDEANVASIGLLRKLGFSFDKTLQIPPDDKPLKRFYLSISSASTLSK